MADSAHTTIPSRRLFLAAGPAAAVFAALGEAARAADTPLAVAIERHRVARDLFVSCQSNDDDVLGDLSSAEFKALEAVARATTASDAELLLKLRYLFKIEHGAYDLEPDMSVEFGSIAIALYQEFTRDSANAAFVGPLWTKNSRIDTVASDLK